MNPGHATGKPTANLAVSIDETRPSLQVTVVERVQSGVTPEILDTTVALWSTMPPAPADRVEYKELPTAVVA